LTSGTVMMLSSAMPTGAVARCGELGVASLLTKPISQSDLLDAVLLALPTTAANETYPAADQPTELIRDRRILLAEDNAVNRAVATGILQKQGHTLFHAENGREALEAVTNGK